MLFTMKVIFVKRRIHFQSFVLFKFILFFQVNVDIINDPHSADQDTRYIYLRMILLLIRSNVLVYDHENIDADADL